MTKATTDQHDLVVRKIGEVSRQLREAATPIQDGEQARIQLDSLSDSVDEIGKSWSGSCIGHHSLIYVSGLRPARPGERFDREWGTLDRTSNATRGEWAEHDFDAVVDALYGRAGLGSDVRDQLNVVSNTARAAFERGKRTLESTLRAVLRVETDKNVEHFLAKVTEQGGGPTATAFLESMLPTNMFSRDSAALAAGRKAPPHLSVLATVQHWRSQLAACEMLADIAEETLEYLLTKYQLEGSTSMRSGRRIFIGHGGSEEWLKLSMFLDKRLGLEPVEFDSESAAGRTRQERLDEMKESADFAFLVFTAEDEQADDSERARQNVVHEYGLMEAQLGRARTIILHEQGCSLPSNLDGVTYIPFPKGYINAVFEDVRGVLEREGMI